MTESIWTRIGNLSDYILRRRDATAFLRPVQTALASWR